MGLCCSKRLCFVRRKSQPFECVRVMHVNGYLEDFDPPVTVRQVTGKPPKHVLCSSAHLLSPGSRPLQPDDQLEPGRVYFLIPRSVFESESSVVELAALVNRLTAAAKKSRPAPARSWSGPSGSSPAGERVKPTESGKCGPEEGGLGRVASTAPRARTWKPRLDRIDERSFGRSMSR